MSQLTRDAIAESERWNLADLFPDAAAWAAERDAIQAEIPSLEALRGSLSQGPSALLAALTRQDQIDERLDRLFAYAILGRDLDTRDNEAIQRYEQAMNLAVAFGRASAWIAPELLTLSDEQLRSAIDAEPGLEPFRRSIEQTIRERPHVRSTEVEEVLAEAAEISRTPGNVFTFLDNADLSFGSITDSDGNEVELTKGRYLRFLQSRDRRVRRESSETFAVPYQQHRHTLGALLSGAAQRDAFYARARRYDSSLEAALGPNAIPIEVYTNLVARVRTYLPLLHRYVAIRKRALGIDDLHNYDLYVPLVDMPDRSFEYGQGRQLVLGALAPLGAPYVDTLAAGLAARWTDVYETSGKRSGAYSMGVYGTHPYVLMNWNATLHDVFTLAHEIGHAMHSWFSSASQPHPTYQYTIFVAEVASTFNERLLTADLLKASNSSQERAYLVNDALETIRTTIFRQTMFAEFELLVHQIVERGEGLTPERLTSEYARLVGDYYGPELALDDQVSIEWARIPHFYSPFYVYQYATGLIAAMALSARVLDGDAEARNRYLAFLASGSSKDPLDLLKDAGVDLTTEQPYQAAFGTMAQYLDILEQSLTTDGQG